MVGGRYSQSGIQPLEPRIDVGCKGLIRMGCQEWTQVFHSYGHVVLRPPMVDVGCGACRQLRQVIHVVVATIDYAGTWEGK